MNEILEETDPQTGLRVITLNRVDKLNALSRSLLKQLKSSLDCATKDSLAGHVRALALRSATPKAFCVGADLVERMGMSLDETRETLSLLRSVMDTLAELPVPTFALIESVAFGGGLELALACDFRFATPNAALGLVETRWAIIPGAGGTQRLSRLVGLTKAKELIFRATRLSAKEALSLGMIDACQDDLSGLLEAWVQDLLEGGPVAIQAAKKALDGGVHLGMPEALDLERSCYELVLPTSDRREGLAAFVEKRKPVYKGI